MAEKIQTTGKITTNVNLYLTDASLAYGKWKDNPKTQISPNTEGTVAFVAQGRSDAWVGNAGTVKYITDDGTTFTLYFDNPYSGANTCTIAGSGGPLGTYTYSVDYPSSGQSWDAKFTITKQTT